MAEWRDNPGRAAPVVGQQQPWCRYAQLAAAAVARRLITRGGLAPRELAETVAGALPRRVGRWLLRRLAALGWLAPRAVIPFDALDGAACPPGLGGCRAAVVRLAVFGLPGQGVAWRDKHRHDLYQQLCAEVLRDAVDLVSLENVAMRVMNSSDVATDPQLAGMLRSFIEEREAALRTKITPADEHARESQKSKLEQAFVSPAHYPTHDELGETFGRLHREFDGCLAQFEEKRAERVLARMRELRARFPVHVPVDKLQECEERFDRFLRQAATYRRQIKDLADQAALAAHQGDEPRSAWMIRRLEAIHTLLPMLLPTEQFEQMRAEISRCGSERETEEAREELLAREQEVADKIKNLAGIIHAFHELAERAGPRDDAYRRAEANYRHALAEIRDMNTEWLTGLVLQLEAFLDDLEDPTGRMQSQLDRFIARVRTALNRLCLEIRAHQASRQSRGDAPPATGQAAAPPPG